MPSEQNKKIKKGKEILKQQQNYFTHLEMNTENWKSLMKKTEDNTNGKTVRIHGLE